jgi:hypothetical protein
MLTVAAVLARLTSSRLCFHLQPELIGLLDRASFDRGDPFRVVSSERGVPKLPGHRQSRGRGQGQENVIDLL